MNRSSILSLLALATFSFSALAIEKFGFDHPGDLQGWQILDEKTTDQLQIAKGRLSFRLTDYATARVGVGFGPIAPGGIDAVQFQASTWTVQRGACLLITDKEEVAQVPLTLTADQDHPDHLYPYTVSLKQAIPGLKGNVIGLAFSFPGPAQEIIQIKDVRLLGANANPIDLHVRAGAWSLPKAAFVAEQKPLFKPTVIREESESPWKNWVYPTQAGPNVVTADLAGPVTTFGFDATRDVDDELVRSLFDQEIVLMPGRSQALVMGEKIDAACELHGNSLYGNSNLMTALLLGSGAKDQARAAAAQVAVGMKAGQMSVEWEGKSLALGSPVLAGPGGLQVPLTGLIKALGYQVFNAPKGIVVLGKRTPLVDPERATFGKALALVPTILDPSYVLTKTRNRLIAPPDRIQAGQSVIQYSQATMDLGSLTQAYARTLGSPKSPLAPALVTGEGPSPDNHTVVRVLNPYQVCVAQFLAFPPRVQGGVRVAAASGTAGARIVCVPVSDPAVREVRVFDCYGGLQNSWVVAKLTPPFLLSTGRFVPGRKDEQIAILSKKGQGASNLVQFYSLEGELLKELPLPIGNLLQVSAERGAASDSLVIQPASSSQIFKVDGMGRITCQIVTNLPQGGIVSVWPFSPGALAAALPDSVRSKIRISAPGEPSRDLDVGRHENMRWSTEFETKPDSYATRGENIHKRIDLGPRFDTVWTDNFYAFARPPVPLSAGQLSGKEPPPKGYSANECAGLWQIPFLGCGFMNAKFFDQLAEEIDSETHLPVNLSVNSDNSYPQEQGKKNLFAMNNPVPAAINRLTFWAQRSYFWDQSPLIRSLFQSEADRGFVGVVPTHEFGIKENFNPLMVRRFRDTLLRKYGSVANVNLRFGTPFKSEKEIDPPRGQGRGDWDRVAVDSKETQTPGSEYYREWRLHVRSMANELNMQCAKEPLLAGFAPETIHYHLIGVWETTARATPGLEFRESSANYESMLDCGTAAGFSNYGPFYQMPSNTVKAANSSGHWSITYGEYGTRLEQGAIDQMRFLFDHGVQFLPRNRRTPDPAYFAYQNQVGSTPRPGLTGGVGEIIGVQQPVYSYTYEPRGGMPDLRVLVPRATGKYSQYAIAQIGNNPESNGLLKSVRQDGLWETSVYVVPFHSKVEITPIMVQAGAFSVGRGTLALVIPKSLYHSDQVEIRFQARCKLGAPKLSILPATDFLKESAKAPCGEFLPGGMAQAKKFGGFNAPFYQADYSPGEQWQEFRYVFSNQIYIDRLAFFLNANGGEVEVRNIEASLQRNLIARPGFFVAEGTPHKGGVTFDVLDRERLAGRPVPSAPPAPAHSTEPACDLFQSDFTLNTGLWKIQSGGEGSLDRAGWKLKTFTDPKGTDRLQIECPIDLDPATLPTSGEVQIILGRASASGLKARLQFKNSPVKGADDVNISKTESPQKIAFDFSRPEIHNFLVNNPRPTLQLTIEGGPAEITLRQVRISK